METPERPCSWTRALLAIQIASGVALCGSLYALFDPRDWVVPFGAIADVALFTAACFAYWPSDRARRILAVLCIVGVLDVLVLTPFWMHQTFGPPLHLTDDQLATWEYDSRGTPGEVVLAFLLGRAMWVLLKIGVFVAAFRAALDSATREWIAAYKLPPGPAEF